MLAFIKYFTIVICLTFCHQSVTGKDRVTNKIDTIYDKYHLDSIDILYVKDPDQALIHIDSLRRRNEASGWHDTSRARLEMINSLIYIYKENPPATLRHAYAVLALTENLTPDNLFWRLMALQYISLTYSASENWFMTARTVHQMEELAQGREKYLWYESVALMIRSQMLAKQNEIEKAIHTLNQAQIVMRRDTSERGRRIAFHNYLDTERFKAGVYVTANRLKEGRACLENLLEFIKTADSTTINRSLYDLTRLRAYAVLCQVCQQMGDDLQAANYYTKAKALQTEYVAVHNLTEYMAEYLLLSGRYKELDSLLTPTLNKATKDGVKSHQVSRYMSQYIQMLNKQGRLSQSAEWSERYVELNDSLQRHVMQNAHDEFAVVYEMKDREAQILENKHALLRNKVWLITLIVFASLLVLGIVLTFYLLCRQRRNNRILYEKIKETNTIFEHLTRFAIAPPATSTTSPNDTLTDDQRTTREVRDYLFENNRFLNKEISPSEIGHHLALSHDTLNIRLNATLGMSLSKYLTMLRLDYSCKLLSTTNLTIDAVADDSGFSSTRTFLRQFKGKYNLSPTKYRKQK